MCKQGEQQEGLCLRRGKRVRMGREGDDERRPSDGGQQVDEIRPSLARAEKPQLSCRRLLVRGLLGGITSIKITFTSNICILDEEVVL